MFDWFDNLCGCFSPELKKGIIEYLSSANYNRNLMEEEKTNEQSTPPNESIYNQVKTKSYYFMKLQQEEEQQQKEQKGTGELGVQEEEGDVLQPNYFPINWQGLPSVDSLYSHKLTALKKILSAETGPQYSKVYDSQDENHIRIYCKPQIYQNRRFNAYRFSFLVHSTSSSLSANNYLTILQDMTSAQPLLTARELLSTTEAGVQVFQRKYKKVLVINQHEFYIAEKSQMLEEGGQPVVYSTVFSVKGDWNKVADYSRGWVNLAGVRVVKEGKEEMQQGEQRQYKDEKEQRQEEKEEKGEEDGRSGGCLRVEGYINCQLEISVNANMLKQPIAKELRVYIQKVICQLTQSDAI